MANQLEVLRLIAPEFSAITDNDAQSFLDLAQLYINPLIYPVESRDLALVLMACNLMYNRNASAIGASSGGAIVREKEGDLERQYSVTNGDGSQVVNTYMQQLTQLSLGITGAGIMTRVNVSSYA